MLFIMSVLHASESEHTSAEDGGVFLAAFAILLIASLNEKRERPGVRPSYEGFRGLILLGVLFSAGLNSGLL